MHAERQSALVVLRSPETGSAAEEEQITASTIAAMSPDKAVAEHARRFFAGQGFELGPLIGISFSITAPAEQMERQFEGFERLAGGGGELPLGGLPPEVRQSVRAVTVEAPPDFGPWNP
jgi:hypothetical protein